ncbi:MAG: acetate--CoA ligase family protein [Deltaproteobacteria bacterium]|nr:acetate--CoA ligase family protein [Deltaproteobacteria bacterium]
MADARDLARRTLSEHDSKELLAAFGLPFARERLVPDPAAAVPAAQALGLPVVVKLCGDGIAHKTERDLVRLDLVSAGAVERAAGELWAKRRAGDGEVALLVAEMVRGRRELIAGLVRDPQFGPCVVLGLGGILTEALRDVVFALAPLTHAEARRMACGLRASHLLTKPFRGEPAADLDALAEVLVGLGRLAAERPDVASVDVNPLIVRADGKPIAVDALVELHAAPASEARPARRAAGLEDRRRGAPEPLSDADLLERFRPLFHPRGIVVAGASTHPGKFGFVTLHNLRAFGYRGELFPVNREGAEILGEPSLRDVAEVPAGRADLVFVCTPAAANVALLRACAKVGVRAAFVASGGYRETGAEGRALEDELVATADELGIVLAGPNGQGVVSTPVSMCAQIVAPYPPPGGISVVSQSGNLLSAFLDYAVQTGVGVAKAISAGNSAQTGLADYLEYFAADPETKVVLAYLEGVGDGRRLADAVRRLGARKPLVVLKGGAAAEGQRAALSHTGSLASDDRVFDGLCRQLGVLRAPTVEEGFEWAATLATQPVPRGRRTVVFTTVGGWGVLTADACAAAGLELVALPDDLRRAIDGMVPARWSRSNPIDLAGGETRDTVPQVLDLLCAHPEVDAVIHLGLGIQAATANLFRQGPFWPEHGLARIAEYHERQERRFAEAARDASERHGKPVLSATELVHCDRAYGNAGPLAVRESGRVCYPSAHRAVAALRALVAWGEHRERAAREAGAEEGPGSAPLGREPRTRAGSPEERGA